MGWPRGEGFRIASGGVKGGQKDKIERGVMVRQGVL